MAWMKGVRDPSNNEILYITNNVRWLRLEAQAVADKPSGIIFQSANDSGVNANHFVWMDHSANLRQHTSEPTDQDSDGSVVGSAGTITLDDAFDNGKLINDSDATGAANAFSVGGAAANDKVEIYHSGTEAHINARADDLYITAAGGNVIFTDQVDVMDDDVKLTLGAAAATDAYLVFDGTELQFYDSAYGTTISLSDMAGSNLNNPTITGDAIITDGKVTWANATDEVVLAITADAVVAGNVVTISADALVAGTILYLSATEATLSAGYYLECYDESASAAVFTVGEDGAVVITGAASDVLTLTTGNVQITDGNIDMDQGKIEVDSTADETSYFKRNNAASANAILEIEGTHTGATGSCLLLDQNATGAAKCLEISHDGDGEAIDISAGAARTGNAITIAMANMVAQTAIDITGGATGTAGEGIIHVDVTGAQAGNAIRVDSTGANLATGSLMVLSSTGAQAAPTEGICAFFEDTGAEQATSYAVTIASTSNEAFHVDTGLSLFDERVTITLADDSGPALAITNPDTTGDTDAVTITPSGAGSGLVITPQEVDTVGLTITVGAANTTASQLVIDGATADWIGAATTGMVHLTCDAPIVADGSLLRIASSGKPAAANDGIAIEIVESGAATATSYAMRIASTNNEALHVDAGKVLVDETLTASLGLITLALDTDVTNPPTDAEIDAVTGAETEVDGCMIFIDDAGGHANAYLCIHDGTKWWQITATACA